jgi:two-component system sensor histidine kinase HydH
MLLDIVDEEVGRLNRLVTDLLRFARPVNVQRAAVSLGELARSTDKLALRHQVQLSVVEDPNVQTVWLDPGLFRLVLDNLVENACQAMSDGGQVEVIVRGEHDGEPGVVVEVRDRGHGMDAAVLERATDPFFTTRPSGTGLGLPIVQRIVEAHGGRLKIESHPGRGTTVILSVPPGEAPAEQRADSPLKQRLA